MIFWALLNARPFEIKNNNSVSKWPLLRDTAWQSLGADHCLTATSMNKGVCTTHCGIGIVSEVIMRGVEFGEGRGAHDMPSPDALTASCPAKNQTSGFAFPAPTEVIVTEQQRQLFSGHHIYTFVRQGGTKGNKSEQEAATI